ncbi:MAG: sigma-70 family RNA polymerase sigma factor [Asticcacaulis sp.]
MKTRSSIDIEGLNRRYRAPLMSFYRRRSVSHSDAEDMTQEVFMRLIASSSSEVENVEAYIFQIAGNILKDRGRRAMVRNSEIARRTLDEVMVVDVFDPSRILLGRESLQRVARYLSDLPERTRHIFVLYRIEGMPQRDIAEGFGISLRAVQKHIANAIEHIVQKASEEGLE